MGSGLNQRHAGQLHRLQVRTARRGLGQRHARRQPPTLGHEWNLIEIQYSGNKVIFNYDPTDSRVDKSEAYHQGTKNVSARLLQSITTYIKATNTASLGTVGAVAVKTTKLGYDNGPISKRSRVTSIQECAGDATSTRCLAATTFNYAPGGGDAYQANANFKSSPLATLTVQSLTGSYGVLLGDFDGDGKTDFIRWSDTPSENQLHLSKGDGTFSPVPVGTGAGQFNITDQNLFKSDGCYMSMVADFNGDGLPDILRYANTTSAGNAACTSPGTPILYQNVGKGSFIARQITGVALNRQISLVIKGCPPNGNPPGSNGLCPNTDPPEVAGWTAGNTFFLLDVDGDGKLDVVTANLPFRNAFNLSDPCAATVCTRVFKGDGIGGFTELVGVNIANKILYSKPSPGYAIGQPSQTVDFDGTVRPTLSVSPTHTRCTARQAAQVPRGGRAVMATLIPPSVVPLAPTRSTSMATVAPTAWTQ